MKLSIRYGRERHILSVPETTTLSGLLENISNHFEIQSSVVLRKGFPPNILPTLSSPDMLLSHLDIIDNDLIIVENATDELLIAATRFFEKIESKASSNKSQATALDTNRTKNTNPAFQNYLPASVKQATNLYGITNDRKADINSTNLNCPAPYSTPREQNIGFKDKIEPPNSKFNTSPLNTLNANENIDVSKDKLSNHQIKHGIDQHTYLKENSLREPNPSSSSLALPSTSSSQPDFKSGDKQDYYKSTDSKPSSNTDILSNKIDKTNINLSRSNMNTTSSLSSNANYPPSLNIALSPFPSSPILHLSQPALDSNKIILNGCQSRQKSYAYNIHDLPSNAQIMLEQARNSLDLLHSQLEECINSTITTEMGDMIRYVIPADNSCLFGCISYLLQNFYSPRYLRCLVSCIVKTETEKYIDAYFGCPRAEYAEWISKDSSWGGFLELCILSDFFWVQFAVCNAETSRLDVYGNEFKYRVFLLYDGMHYDALVSHPVEESKRYIFAFNPLNTDIEQKALTMAKHIGLKTPENALKRAKLKCMICGLFLHGQQDAIRHSENSGHVNICEVPP